MRTRAWVAAVAGGAGAVTAHWLDVAGRLPFVHESGAIRSGMTPLQVLLWLLVAAGACALASTRVAALGAPVAVVVSATPELLARHDLGAVTEPGAIVGAALQLPVLVAVVTLALILERRVPVVTVRPLPAVAASRVAGVLSPLSSLLVRSGAAPRAPPGVLPSYIH